MRKSRYFSRWNFDDELNLDGATEFGTADAGSEGAEGATEAAPQQEEVSKDLIDTLSEKANKIADRGMELLEKLGVKGQSLIDDAKKVAASAASQLKDGIQMVFSKEMVAGVKGAVEGAAAIMKEDDGAKEAFATLLLVYSNPAYLNKPDNVAYFSSKISALYAIINAGFLKDSTVATSAFAKAVKGNEVTPDQIKDLVAANYKAIWQASAMSKSKEIVDAIAQQSEYMNDAHDPTSRDLALTKIRDAIVKMIAPQLNPNELIYGAKLGAVGSTKMLELAGVMKNAGDAAGIAECPDHVAADAAQKIKSYNTESESIKKEAALEGLEKVLSAAGVASFTISEIIGVTQDPSGDIINRNNVNSLIESLNKRVETFVKSVSTASLHAAEKARSWGLSGVGDWLESFAIVVGERSKDDIFRLLANRYKNYYDTKADFLNALEILKNVDDVTNAPEGVKSALALFKDAMGGVEKMSKADRQKILADLKAYIEKEDEVKKQGFSRVRYAEELNNLRRIKIAMRRYYSAVEKMKKNSKNFAKCFDGEEEIAFLNDGTDLEGGENYCGSSNKFCGTVNDFCGGQKKGFSSKKRVNPFSKFNFADGEDEEAPAEEDEELMVEEDIEEPADEMEAGAEDEGFDMENDADMGEELPEEDTSDYAEEEWDMSADEVDNEEGEEEFEAEGYAEGEDEVAPGIVAPTREETEVPHWGDEGDAMDSMLGDDSIMQSEYADQYDSKPGELTLSAANAGEAMAMQNDLAVLHGVDQLKGESNFSRSRRAVRQPVSRMSALQKLLGDKYIK